MSNMSVEIIVKGLIAVAPLFEPTGADHMTALVVDSRQAPPEAVCMEQQHEPEIEFPTTALQCTAIFTNGCRWLSNRNTCICALDRQDITLVPDAQPTSKLPRLDPPRAMPFNNLDESDATFDYKHSAGSFAYVANLSHLGYSLNPAFLGSSPPGILAARFRFPFESLLACDHATRPDDGSDNVHALEFRKLGAKADPGDHCQVAAQTLVARVTLDASSQTPTLLLTRFDGTAEYAFELTGPEPIEIRLRNHRPLSMSLPLDDPCDDGVGRDFAFFYELVNAPPSWNERPVPRVKHTWWKAYSDVTPGICEKYKTPTSRPICPMVRIE